jgi:cytochrome c oxidase subunit 3
MNPEQAVLDASFLPSGGFKSRSVVWWGIIAMIAIEGTMFGILAASYFYLRLNFAEWPPHGTAPPDLGVPTITFLMLLISIVPMYIGDRLAISGTDNRAMLLWVWIGIAFSALILAVRCFEFDSLRCRWDDNASGSIVWFIIGVHTGHILASTIETLVLALHLRGKEIDVKHRVDVHVDAVYWYFIVASWSFFYFLIYWSPRWL